MEAAPSSPPEPGAVDTFLVGLELIAEGHQGTLQDGSGSGGVAAYHHLGVYKQLVRWKQRIHSTVETRRKPRTLASTSDSLLGAVSILFRKLLSSIQRVNDEGCLLSGQWLRQSVRQITTWRRPARMISRTGKITCQDCNLGGSTKQLTSLESVNLLVEPSNVSLSKSGGHPCFTRGWQCRSYSSMVPCALSVKVGRLQQWLQLWGQPALRPHKQTP